jgi:hypothetical protein
VYSTQSIDTWSRFFPSVSHRDWQSATKSRKYSSALLNSMVYLGQKIYHDRVNYHGRDTTNCAGPQLETAINGRADAIVTFNDRDFRPVAALFRCSVVRPGEVIRGFAEETELWQEKE